MDKKLRERAAALRPARTSAFIDRLNRVGSSVATRPAEDGSETAANASSLCEAETPKPGKPQRLRAPRKESSSTAYITFEDLSQPLECRVVNISATGARLRLTPRPSDVIIPPRDMPDRIILIFRTDRAQVDCAIQWRTASEIGVRFVSATRHSAQRAALRPEPTVVGAGRFASRRK
jgi:hypothetical protein